MTEDYRDVKKAYWKQHHREGVISLKELMESGRPRLPQHGDHWGNWMLDAERLVLMHTGGGHGYELDLERMRTPAEMLDSIFQVRPKVWHTNDDMAALIEALHDLLDPQANLCSFGVAKTIENPSRILRQVIEHHPML